MRHLEVEADEMASFVKKKANKQSMWIAMDLANYLVPVNADVADLDAVSVEEDDLHVNALGVKGVGELALVGVAPAIANAVFHATGKRVRDFPHHARHGAAWFAAHGRLNRTTDRTSVGTARANASQFKARADERRLTAGCTCGVERTN